MPEESLKDFKRRMNEICLKAFWSNEELETDNCNTGCEETYCKKHPLHVVIDYV